MKTLCLSFLVSLFFLFACSESTQKESPGDLSALLASAPMCGTVQFSDGCSPVIDSLIQYGLALVHHMTYDDAELVFDKVIQHDADCFWGPWGKALTYIHPLWPDVPTEERMTNGWTLAQQALGLAKNDKEKLYANALAAYYRDGATKTENERLTAYEAAWGTASEQRPEDIEARLFHALARLSNVSPNDKTYAVNLEVGATAEGVLKEIPDHPGGFHYAIHAYDLPPLAHKAVRVARNYSKIAPEIPHALHMPTHIFTRLGHWQESIDWNERSAAAAWKMPAGDQVSMHYLHALDYLTYARLQQAEDEMAAAIVAGLDTLTDQLQVHAGTAYTLAAAQGRLAIEQKRWEDAAAIAPLKANSFPWEKFPQFEALSHFAKGIGAARSGQVELAQEAADRLATLQAALGDAPSAQYWANQVDIQKTAVQAWVAHAQKQPKKALELMDKAAAMEDATEKNPITPGELVPIRELYGDLLLELNRPAEALAQYKRSLERNPNRMNTVFGAAKAAELSGDTEQATTYFKQLLELKGPNAGQREQLAYAAERVGMT